MTRPPAPRRPGGRDHGRRWRELAGLVFTVLLSVGTLAAQDRVVLTGATLIDGTGGPPIPGGRVIIEGGRFTCVSGPDGCPSRPGDREVSLAGRWLIPGLIDAHVHLPIAVAPDGLPRLQRLRFAMGITTVRDADSRSVEAILAERALAEEPARPTPRIVVAARITPEYAERFGARLGAPLVERLAALGVDAIKIKEPFDGEVWREEIQTARALGLPAYGHTWGGGNPRGFTGDAVLAGISGITHLMGVAPWAQPPAVELIPPDSAPDPWAWHKQLWVTADSARLEGLIGTMIDHGVWFEPTMATEYYWGNRMAPPWEPRFLRDPPRLRAMLLRQSPPREPIAPAYPEPWRRQRAFVREFIRRGGMVIAGSDGVRPGLDLHEEMRLIGEAAGSPMAGLLAGTRNAAIALNRPDLGTVEVGKWADAVIYDADPLGAPGATLHVVSVIKGGRMYPADSLAAEFEAEYDARVAAAWRGRLLRGGKLLAILVAAGMVLVLGRRRWRR